MMAMESQFTAEQLAVPSGFSPDQFDLQSSFTRGTCVLLRTSDVPIVDV